jgi:predicted small lipoprotein YifL
MKTSAARLIALIGFAVAIAACGQRGPLFLPGDPSSVQTEIPPVPPVPDDEPEDNGEPDNGQAQ